MSASSVTRIQNPERYWAILRNLLTLLLLTGLAFSLAELVWTLLPPGMQEVPPGQPATANSSVPGKEQAISIQPILSAHLFGKPVAPAQAPRTVQEVKKTRLQLTLHGVVATGAEDAIAIISANRGDAVIHRAGSMVMPGVKLREISQTHVILEREGKLEQLDLVDSEALIRGNAEAVAKDEIPEILPRPYRKR